MTASREARHVELTGGDRAWGPSTRSPAPMETVETPDCADCGACCREAYHAVEVDPDDQSGTAELVP